MSQEQESDPRILSQVETRTRDPQAGLAAILERAGMEPEMAVRGPGERKEDPASEKVRSSLSIAWTRSADAHETIRAALLFPDLREELVREALRLLLDTAVVLAPYCPSDSPGLSVPTTRGVRLVQEQKTRKRRKKKAAPPAAAAAEPAASKEGEKAVAAGA